MLLHHYQDGLAWQAMRVLLRCNKMSEALKQSGHKYHIPIKSEQNPQGVHCMARHASKGLGYALVYIPTVGMPTQYAQSSTQEAQPRHLSITGASNI